MTRAVYTDYLSLKPVIQLDQVRPLVNVLPDLLARIHTGEVIASPSLEFAIISALKYPVPPGRTLYLRGITTEALACVLQQQVPVLQVEFPMYHDLWFGAALWFLHRDLFSLDKPVAFFTQYHVLRIIWRGGESCVFSAWRKHILLPTGAVTVSTLPDMD